jgi:hypothetical protein
MTTMTTQNSGARPVASVKMGNPSLVFGRCLAMLAIPSAYALERIEVVSVGLHRMVKLPRLPNTTILATTLVPYSQARQGPSVSVHLFGKRKRDGSAIESGTGPLLAIWARKKLA